MTEKEQSCPSGLQLNVSRAAIHWETQYVPGPALGQRRNWLTWEKYIENVLSHVSNTSCSLWPARLLCPWDTPGKNTGVGCHFLLQGIFWPRDGTHFSCVSCIGRHWQADSLPLSHLGSPQNERMKQSKKGQWILKVQEKNQRSMCGQRLGNYLPFREWSLIICS